MDAVLVVMIITNLILAGVCWSKGKHNFAIVGALLFAPLVWVGAIRLAKPGTAWFDKYPYAKRRLAWERFENTSFEIAA